MTKQETWEKEGGYIWSLIGSAVGFANLLSFSALCYRNGGGAFLIPYFLAHLIIGLPMLYLEGLIGQKTKLPIVSAMGSVAGARGRMVGWIAVFSCATIGGFYMVLTGFAVAYTYFAAVGTIGADTTFFFKQTFLHDSGSLAHCGGIALGVLFATILVACFAWAVLARNIRSGVEKLCTLFLPLLAILITAFAVAALFLPGAMEGVKHFLIPDFRRLSEWALWRDVFGQVFFSLSLGLGIVTGYSRHNRENFNIPRAMVRVALGDFVISFISGLAIFACMGFMSMKSGVAFADLVQSDSAFEIGFVIFPMILTQFGPVAQIIGPLFFFCIFIAGVTGVFSIGESVAGNIEVEFGRGRKSAVAIAMGVITIFSIPFCMGNGQHLIGAIAPMVLGNTMLLGGIAEIFLFLVLSPTMSKDPLWFSGKRRSYSFLTLKYIVLPLLTLTFLGALYQEARGGFHFAEALRWSWLASVLVVAGYLGYRKEGAVKLLSSPTLPPVV